MVSIFQRKDAEVNPEEGFWQSVPEDFTVSSINIVHHDVVKVQVDSELVDQKLLLGDTALYLYEESPQDEEILILKRANIQWKHFEPFVEERRPAVMHGFKIGLNKCFKEFYTQNAAKLDAWLLPLSRLCVMSEVKLDYQITKIIGKGSYAVVYQGHSTEDRASVAVKRIKKTTIEKSDKHITALENEIAAMRVLNYPRIARLFRVYESSRDVCLVQEAIAGGELLERLAERGSFPEATVKVFAQKLLEALQYMHSKGVVHRDLKPENILLTAEGEDIDFKIIDFGLAAVGTSARLLDRCGSPGYVAPEVLDKQPYDFKVDIFSAGVVLYIMLSGRSPFPGETAREVLKRNLEGRIDFKTQELDHVSIEFVKFIQNLTQVDPERRPTASQALQSRLFHPSGNFDSDDNLEMGGTFKGTLQLKHTKRHSVSKPEFHLEVKQVPKQAFSNSPIMKHEVRKLANIQIGTASNESSPQLPPLRALVSPASRNLTHRTSARALTNYVPKNRKQSKEELALPRYVINLQR
mmetsp:Transcript_25599/g.44700  ORF Transcript_25599/g.44700 Transcript_25599/m.44700 type:complete len:524 (+) Transcript_25599:346-1917(+)